MKYIALVFALMVTAIAAIPRPSAIGMLTATPLPVPTCSPDPTQPNLEQSCLWTRSSTITAHTKCEDERLGAATRIIIAPIGTSPQIRIMCQKGNISGSDLRWQRGL